MFLHRAQNVYKMCPIVDKEEGMSLSEAHPSSLLALINTQQNLPTLPRLTASRAFLVPSLAATSNRPVMPCENTLNTTPHVSLLSKYCQCI